MPVFTHLLFSQLEDNTKEAVRASTRRGVPEAAASAWPIDTREVFDNRLDLPKALERSKAFVDAVQPVAFSFLSEAQRSDYEDELSFAFYLTLADCELAILEGRSGLARRHDNLLHIAQLLTQLRGQNKAEADAYQGICRMREKQAAALKKTTVDGISNVVEYPASLNDGRLYLVWVAEMLDNICSEWEDAQPFLSFTAINLVLYYISLGTGFIGWSLYFLRGGMHTLFLFEISAEIKALDLTNEEAWAYFWGKWDERKIQILNDAVWGLVNFLCFFFLYGGGLPGYYGDLLNGVLFIVDVLLSLWDYLATKDEFIQIQAEYDAAIARISAEAQYRRDDLARDKKTFERNWTYQCAQLQLDVWYSVTILLAVTLSCCFFVPPGILLAPTVSGLMIVGSAMCFGLGIVYEALSSRLDLLKVAEETQDIQTEIGTCSDHIRQLAQDGHVSESKVGFTRLLYLEEQAAYQAQLSHYHHANMYCNLVTDISFPLLLVGTFLLMPTAIGTATFALGVFLMFVANCYVAGLAPKDVRDDSVSLTMLTKCSGFFAQQPDNHQEEMEMFPEERYEVFCAAA